MKLIATLLLFGCGIAFASVEVVDDLGIKVQLKSNPERMNSILFTISEQIKNISILLNPIILDPIISLPIILNL